MFSDDIINDIISRLKFNDAGLIPAIAQDIHTKDVLMMAWQNAESVRATLTDGYAIYWSRSRNQLWRKGDTTGHTSKLVSFRYDCDGDTVLMLVEQTGAACHTMRKNCFFYQASDTGITIISEPII